MTNGFTMAALTACATILFAIPAPAAGPPAEVARLSPALLQRRFEAAFARQDQKTLMALAAGHPDQLRPVVEALLANASTAVLNDEPAAAQRQFALSALIAEASKDPSEAPFLLRQIDLYRSWTRDECRLKSQADAHFSQAKVAFEEGHYGAVADPGRCALKLYVSLRDEAGEGDTLHFLGQAGRRLPDYAAAQAWHQQALQRAREVADRLREGTALIDLGDVHERRKDYSQATGSYLEALKVLKPPADYQETIRALLQLGDLHVSTGNFAAAYAAYSQALVHAEGVCDVLLVARINDHLGFCHRQLGDCGKAIEYHRRALVSADALASGEARQRARARSLNHLGICTAELARSAACNADLPKAREHYREAIGYEENALSLAAGVQDRERQGYVLRELCFLHLALGGNLEGEAATAEYDRGLSIAGKALALAPEMQEKEWEGLALHCQGLVLSKLGRQSEGLAAFNKALGLWEQIGDPKSAGVAHTFVAREFHEAAGRLDDALASYDQALVAFRKVGDVESEGLALTGKARVLIARHRTDEATQLYADGLAKLESVRAKARFPEFRKAFMGKIYDRYEEAALFAIGQGCHDRAFRYAECMKARTFLDQLAESHVELEKGIAPELKAKRDALEQAIQAVGVRLAAECRKPSPDVASLDTLRAEMERQCEGLDRVKKQVRVDNADYASIQYPDPIVVPELQKGVLASGETMLEYFFTATRVYCFVISNQHFETLELAPTSEEVRSKVAALLENLKSGLARGDVYDRRAAGELYDILLKPAAKFLKGQTLIIVPDDILALLPFEALVVNADDKRSYLLEGNPVKYVQSATILATLRRPHPSAATDGFIGFGDPVYDYERFRKGEPEDAPRKDRGESLGQFGELAGKLSRLEASGDEVRTINGLFHETKREGKVLVREDAREGYAKSADMKRYGFIHFAMHALLAPDLQAIAFSQIPGESEDGLLTLGEIMNLHFNARMVVLSACQTGLGRLERGEGVTGLTRAVMYAGSPAAVVSLWSVDDRGTGELMRRFYASMLRKDVPKAEALREAKRGMLATLYQQPCFWAAFVMYGE